MTTPSPSPPISLSPTSAGERLARCTAPPAHSSPPPVPYLYYLHLWVSNPILYTKDSILPRLSLNAVNVALPSPLLPHYHLISYHHTLQITRSGRVLTARTYQRQGGSRFGFVLHGRCEEKAIGVLEMLGTHRYKGLVYTLLEDAKDSRSCISQRVDMDSQQVNLLMGDRMTLQETVCYGRGGGPSMLHERGLGSLDRIESGDSSGASDLSPTLAALRETAVAVSGTVGRDSPECTRGHETRELKAWSVFNISGYAIVNQVSSATYTLLGDALDLVEWSDKNLSQRTEKVDKYISGIPDNIYGNVKSARPKTLDETIELANDLMDQKLCTYAGKKAI
ncbi:hypothetical protein Tco_0327164 [Tanacetum coccineum]